MVIAVSESNLVFGLAMIYNLNNNEHTVSNILIKRECVHKKCV